MVSFQNNEPGKPPPQELGSKQIDTAKDKKDDSDKRESVVRIKLSSISATESATSATRAREYSKSSAPSRPLPSQPQPKEVTIDPAIKDHRIAAHFLGDSFISSSWLQKTKLEGMGKTEIYPFAIRLLEKEKESAGNDKEYKAYLESTIARLKDVMEIEKQFETIESSTYLFQTPAQAFATWMQERINKMQPGSRLLIPGGWNTANGGHAMFYEIIKIDSGKYNMLVFNSGGGLNYHPSTEADTSDRGLKEKFLPILTEVNLDFNPELTWREYYELLHRPPQRSSENIKEYSAESVYEKFLHLIRPNFGKTSVIPDPTESDFITGQRQGTCTADVLFQFMRAESRTVYKEHNLDSATALRAYKRSKLKLKYAVIQQYYAHLINSGFFAKKDRKSEDIVEETAILEFLGTCNEKFVRSIHKAIGNGWLSTEEAEQMKMVSTEISTKVTEVISRSTGLISTPIKQLMSARDTSTFSFRSVSTAPATTNKRVSPAFSIITDKVNWLNPNQDPPLNTRLKAWLDRSKELFSKGEKNDKEVHAFIKQLYTEMPSVSNLSYWDSIPPAQLELCLVYISELSELFIRSKKEIYLTLDGICHVQKVLAVSTFLAHKIEGLKDIRINTDFLSHNMDKNLSAKNGHMTLYNGQLEKELTDTLKFFQDVANGSGSPPQGQGLFLLDFNKTTYEIKIPDLDSDGMAAWEQRKKNEDPDFYFVYNYLKTHPDVVKNIKSYLNEVSKKEARGLAQIFTRSEPPEPSSSQILAVALTDLEGKFLPKAFCALRKQAYLTQMFMQKMSPNYLAKESDPIISISLKDGITEWPSRKDLKSETVKIDFIYTINKQQPEYQFHDAHDAMEQEGVPILVFLLDGNLSNQTQNQMIINSAAHSRGSRPRAPQIDTAELSLLRCGVDKSQQLEKTISYFSNFKHLNKLKNLNYQILFEGLIFERGILSNAMNNKPEVIEKLAQFIQKGHKFHIEDPKTAIFFARMGSYLQSYCNSYGYTLRTPLITIDPRAESQVSPLDPWARSKEKCLLEDQLAAWGREKGPFKKSDYVLILTKEIMYQATTSLSVEKNYHLDADIKNLYRRVALDLQTMDVGQRNSILTAVLSKITGSNIPLISWDLNDFPIAATEDNSHQIDLATGALISVSGSVSSESTTVLLNLTSYSFDYNRIFGHKSIKRISYANPNDIFFECEGNQYRVFKQRNNELIICRNFNGNWCPYYSADDPRGNRDRQDHSRELFWGRIQDSNTITRNCHCWQTKDGLIFFDKKTNKLCYEYDSNNNLVCVGGKGDLRNGLMLANMISQTNKGYEFFQKFDPTAQIWKDSTGIPMVVELPYYGLEFKLEHHGKQVTEISSVQYPGFHLANIQYVHSLRRVPAYIVLINDAGERKVIVPQRAILKSNVLTETLTLSQKEREETQHVLDLKPAPSYGVYPLSPTGELLLSGVELKDQLYLVNLYLKQRLYDKALASLNNILIPDGILPPLILQRLCEIAINKNPQTDDMDARACSLRLKVRAILVANIKNHGERGVPLQTVMGSDWNTDFGSYLSQKSHAPIFALSVDEELLLIRNSGLTRSDIIAKRLNFLEESIQNRKAIGVKEREVREVDIKRAQELTERPTDLRITESEYEEREQKVEREQEVKELESSPRKTISAITIERSQTRESSFQNPLDSVIKAIGVKNLQKINPNVLKDKIPSQFTYITRPDPKEFLTQFLSFYKIAREQATSEEVVRLRHLIVWAGENPLLDQLVRILESVMAEPEKWETIQQLQQYLAKTMSAEKSTHDTLFGQFLNELYSKAIKLTQESPFRTPQKFPPFSRAIPQPIEFRGVDRKEISAVTLPAPITTITVPLFNKTQPEITAAALKSATKSNLELQKRLESVQQSPKLDRVGRRAIRELQEDVRVNGEEERRLISERHTLNPNQVVLAQSKETLAYQIKEGAEALQKMEEKLLELANKLPAEDTIIEEEAKLASEEDTKLTKEDKLKKLSLIRELEILGKRRTPLTLESLEQLYICRNINLYKDKNNALTDDNVKILHLKIEEYLIHKIHQQQLHRGLSGINKLEKLIRMKGASDPTVQELSESVRSTLSEKREYDPKEHPAFLVFEARTKMLLRKEQVDTIEKMQGKAKFAIVQLIMGAGKTDVLAPLLVLEQANGKNLSMYMVPQATREDVISKMPTRNGEIFHQVLNLINWYDTSLEGLTNTYARLQAISRNRQFLLITDKEIHDFVLQARKARLQFLKDNIGNPNILSAYSNILEFLNINGDILIDEAEQIMGCRSDVRIASGSARHVPDACLDMSTLAYEVILTDPEVKKEIYFDFSFGPPEKTAIPFTQNRYQKQCGHIVDEMLKKLFQIKPGTKANSVQIALKKSQNQDGLKEAIRSFLLGRKGASIPKELDEDTRKALATLGSQVQIFLSITLSKLYNQHYGFFPGAMTDEITYKPLFTIAGPFNGANSPSIGSQFGNPTEQVNFTIQAYSENGIPLAIMEYELRKLLDKAKQQQRILHTTSLEETPAYQEYRQMWGEDFDRAPTLNPEASEVVAEALRNDPKKLLYFVRKYILPKIEEYDRMLVSNSQHLPEVFHTVKGFSGTLANSETLHPDFVIYPAIGIHGRILSHLPQTELLANELIITAEGLEGLNAIIDAGGIFKYESQEELAKKILNIRTDLEAVIFYSDNDRMILKQDPLTKNPLTAVKCTPDNDVSPEKRFTVYDQKHCRGTHIDQAINAKAGVTHNKNETLSEGEQSITRFRGIITGTQSARFHASDDLKQIICDSLYTPSEAEVKEAEAEVKEAEAEVKEAEESQFSKKPENLDHIDLMVFISLNQAQQQSEDNVVAIQQQMENMVFQLCEGVLKSVKVDKLGGDPIFAKLAELQETITVGDPIAQFGQLEHPEEALTVLNHYKEVALHRFKEWYNDLIKLTPEKLGFYEKLGLNMQQLKVDLDTLDVRMNALIQDALKKEKVPEQLPFRDSPVSNTKGSAVQIDVSIKAKTEERTETRMNLKLQIQSKEDLSKDTREPHFPYRWISDSIQSPEIYREHYYDTEEGFTIESELKIRSESDIKMEGDRPSRNPLLKVNDAFAVFKRDTIAPPIFSDRLILSKNLLYTTTTDSSILENINKIGPCLVVQKPDDSLSFVLLDGAESERYYKQLMADKLSKPKEGALKIGLYRPGIGIYPEPNPLHVSTDSKEFKELEVQYKLLRGEIIDYSEPELDYLKAWLRGQENHQGVFNFIYEILLKKNEDRELFLGSRLGTFFAYELGIDTSQYIGKKAIQAQEAQANT